MAAKITEDERRQIRELLAQGLSSEEVARRLGVPKMRVAATKAHTTMGTYADVSAVASDLDIGDLDDAADAQDLKSARSAGETRARPISPVSVSIHSAVIWAQC